MYPFFMGYPPPTGNDGFSNWLMERFKKEFEDYEKNKKKDDPKDKKKPAKSWTTFEVFLVLTSVAPFVGWAYSYLIVMAAKGTVTNLMHLITP